MTYEQVLNLLLSIEKFYKLEVNKSLVNAWLSILKDYDGEEVNRELQKVISEERYQKDLPNPYFIVRNLTKNYDKVDYNKLVVYCSICRRPVNQSEYEKHFSRCSSVEYIVDQYNRFGLELRRSVKELYEMSDDDFDRNYLLVLSYVKDHTNNESERQRIEFIFKNPSQVVAKRYLSGK